MQSIRNILPQCSPGNPFFQNQKQVDSPLHSEKARFSAMSDSEILSLNLIDKLPILTERIAGRSGAVLRIAGQEVGSVV